MTVFPFTPQIIRILSNGILFKDILPKECYSISDGQLQMILNILVFEPSDSRISNSCISAKYNKPHINGHLISLVFTWRINLQKNTLKTVCGPYPAKHRRSAFPKCAERIGLQKLNITTCIRRVLTSRSERWSEPELNPLVSESTGLMEWESKKDWELKRAMPGNFSRKSVAPSDESEKLGSLFERWLGVPPKTLWTEKKKIRMIYVDKKTIQQKSLH